MEIVGKEKNEFDNNPSGTSGLWFWGYVIAGLIYYQGNKMSGITLIDKLIVAIVSIAAGIIWYRVVKKGTINLVKNDTGNKILDAIIAMLVSGFVIGFLTRAF